MSRARLASLAPVVAVALLAACGDGTGVDPAHNLDSLLARAVTAQSLGVGATVMAGGVAFPTAPVPVRSECQFNVANKRFNCPARGLQGVTINLYYQLLDAGQQPQSAFDPATTAALRTVSVLSGALQGGTSFTVVSGSSDHALGGLLNGEFVLSGTATRTQSGAGSLTATETMVNLVLPRPGSGKRWPESGSIVTDLGTSQIVAAHATMVFDGSSSAILTFEENGTTQTCTVDLQSPGLPVCD